MTGERIREEMAAKQNAMQGSPPKQRQIVYMTVLLLIGVAAGAAAAVYYDIFSGKNIFPTLFSGIPELSRGFPSCFSTYLMNFLLFLIPIYMFGLSAFGSAFISAILLIKGIAAGVGAISFFNTGDFSTIAQCAMIYTPALAVTSFLTVAFALRAKTFSKKINDAVHSKSSSQQISFRNYFQELLLFLFVAVIACTLIAVFVWGIAML